tara:strand:- start:320 stop:574 length:255 start_codon:yes stop_codon:yes gene_type:complete
MKELDTKEMDSEEQELYSMLKSKFNPKEMERLAKLMIIDGEKYHQEKLNNLSQHIVISTLRVCATGCNGIVVNGVCNSCKADWR